jgi:flagellar biosynthesis/type III secretory pathway protein FliH
MGIDEFVLDQTRKQAYEENFRIGYAEGFKIGYAKGVETAKRQIGLKMKEYNLDIDYVANITGLSIEAIQQL